MTVFVRDQGDVRAVDVGSEATVRDLLSAVCPDGTDHRVMSFQGALLEDNTALLADIGLSAESVIDLVDVPPSTISVWVQMFRPNPDGPGLVAEGYRGRPMLNLIHCPASNIEVSATTFHDFVVDLRSRIKRAYWKDYIPESLRLGLTVRNIWDFAELNTNHIIAREHLDDAETMRQFMNDVLRRDERDQGRLAVEFVIDIAGDDPTRREFEQSNPLPEASAGCECVIM